MKKAFDQTVRDLKREVNKKVLKVPGIEQKVLDATSNEPWGPHGTHLADIAQATKNYHEYQMIMSVIWKRINDTGKNWRHVYKALTVLEYLVGHGSERVIDEIREHAYQISTLADFQYIDSSGRDQGNNVRKKSQSLVALVNDKERIQEVRQKAAANREKFRNTSFAGGMYRPSSHSSSGGYGDRYDDDRYEGRYGRDEDRNGYGREREWGSRDEDRYGRNGDSYGREEDRHGRDSEDRYSRDGNKDDDYRGRSRSNEDYQYGSRSRSADRERDHAFDEESNHSSRGGARTDEHPQYGRRLERKFSEQNLDAPPSYEEAVADAQSPFHEERDGGTPAAPAPKTSPPVSTSPTQPATAADPASPPASKKVDSFDEFDPRNSVSAVPAAPITPVMDLLGSLSESFPSNSLALVPSGYTTTTSEADVLGNAAGSAPTYTETPAGSAVVNQAFDDPFGDGPFRALPSSESVPAQPQDSASTSSFQFNTTPPSGPPFPTQGVSTSQPTASSQFSSQDQWIPQQSNDILADILPPSGSSASAVPAPTGLSLQPNSNIAGGFPPPSGSADHAASQFSPQIPTGPAAQYNSGDFLSHLGSAVPVPSQAPFQGPVSSQSPFQNPVPSQSPFHTPGPSQSPFQAPGPSQSPFQVPGPSHSPFQAPGPSQAPFQHPVPSQAPFQPTVPSQAPFQPTVPSQAPFQPPVPSQTPFQASGPPQTPFQASGPPQTLFQASGPPQTPFQASGPLQTPFQASGPLQIPLQPSGHSQTTFQPSGPSQTPIQASGPSQAPFQYPSGPATHPSNDALSSIFTQGGSLGSVTSQSTAFGSTSSHAIVPQSSKDKFETKSTVWADTLSRGLVNLNISGSKINPLADIGIDFDAINRKEKRMEKPNPAATAPVSTTTMGKAMGTGSGLGRAGASSLRPLQNSMMGSGMGMGMNSGRGAGMNNMGMGSGPGGGMGMGMGGYGVMNQQPMGVGMNMGIGQGAQMQQPTGMRPGGYNPMMGSGGYAPQQPYGGGYR